MRKSSPQTTHLRFDLRDASAKTFLRVLLLPVHGRGQHDSGAVLFDRDSTAAQIVS